MLDRSGRYVCARHEAEREVGGASIPCKNGVSVRYEEFALLAGHGAFSQQRDHLAQSQ